MTYGWDGPLVQIRAGQTKVHTVLHFLLLLDREPQVPIIAIVITAGRGLFPQHLLGAWQLPPEVRLIIPLLKT